MPQPLGPVIKRCIPGSIWELKRSKVIAEHTIQIQFREHAISRYKETTDKPDDTKGLNDPIRDTNMNRKMHFTNLSKASIPSLLQFAFIATADNYGKSAARNTTLYTIALKIARKKSPPLSQDKSRNETPTSVTGALRTPEANRPYNIGKQSKQGEPDKDPPLLMVRSLHI